MHEMEIPEVPSATALSDICRLEQPDKSEPASAVDSDLNPEIYLFFTKS